MNLKRTTILPIDNAELSETIFQSFVQKEMMILMIIIGDGPEVRTAVERADDLAGTAYFQVERWVLWIRDHEVLRAVLTAYLQKVDGRCNYEEIKCFSLSPVKDLPAGIISGDTELTYLNLQQSFFTAHKQDLKL